MTKIRTKLAPPWITFVNEIMAMFKEDPNVAVFYDNDTWTVKVLVDNDAVKAAALDYILPDKVSFANIDLNVIVVPSNSEQHVVEHIVEYDFEHMLPETVFELAFAENPAFKKAVTIEGIFCNNITYVVFKKEVVQFFNDNLNDIDGKVSTLYEEIARDLFKDNTKLRGVCYCTEAVSDKLMKPLGEWP